MKNKVVAAAILAILAFSVIIVLSDGRICGQAFTWAKNDETGRCRYFPTTCVDAGYSSADVKECDCSNLENYYLDMAIESCRLNQGLVSG